MNLAIVLVHNKGDQGNFDQIETLKPLITKITEQNVDEEGNSFETYHYELQGISQPHELRLYQIIPFGVKEPTNFNDIDSHNVIYRKGDEDKVGDHPRFYNWGLKRSTDYGADYTYIIQDVSQFDPVSINDQLNPQPVLVKGQPQRTIMTSINQDSAGVLTAKEHFFENGNLPEDQPLQDSLNVAVASTPVMEVLNG